MVDEVHEFELPEGSLGVGHVLERPRQLLDRHVRLPDLQITTFYAP